jgi:Phage integrase family
VKATVVADVVADPDVDEAVSQHPGRAGQGRQGSLRHAVSATPEDSTYVLAVHSAEAMVFPGRDDERPLIPNVLHAACRPACAAAGLSKPVTVHTLRHTFATHLKSRAGKKVVRQGRTCVSSKSFSVMPAFQARRATPGSQPRRSATRRARSIGSLGSRATRLSGFHGSGAGGGGHFPPPWRSDSTGARWSPRVRRASHCAYRVIATAGSD